MSVYIVHSVEQLATTGMHSTFGGTLLVTILRPHPTILNRKKGTHAHSIPKRDLSKPTLVYEYE